MDLATIKQQLIAEIQASSDEYLIMDLLDMVKQYQAGAYLSPAQMKDLDERINMAAEGKVTYLNAKEEIAKLKKRLNEL